MNLQDTNKAVVIANFTICGVEGFKTVFAAGGKPAKRMVSALNDMHRKFKDKEKELGSQYDAAASDTDKKLCQAFDSLSDMKRALRLITTIKDRIMLHGDTAQLALHEQMYTISTEQFLTESGWVYEENVANFLAKLDEIDVAIDKHLEKLGQNVASVKTTILDLEPHLCVCTGGIFGERPFYLFITPLDILEMAQGNFQQAIQFFVSSALITVKNFKLSDYLRVTGEAQEKVKQDLLFIDKHLDLLHEIKAVKAGSVISIAGMGNGKSKTTYDRVKNTSDVLMLESEYRLCDRVIAACSENHLAAHS